MAALNRGIDRARPWEWLTKGDHAGLRATPEGWVAETRVRAAGLAPFLPAMVARIEASLMARPVRVGATLFLR